MKHSQMASVWSNKFNLFEMESLGIMIVPLDSASLRLFSIFKRYRIRLL